MSLLSRTLQSILSKYILDVDVEGIALPSLFDTSSSSSSTTQGTSSSNNNNGAKTNTNGTNDTSGGEGWGVRLSNVKLREGVQLMVLPGKLPSKSNATNNRAKKSTKTNTTTKDQTKQHQSTTETTVPIVEEENKTFTTSSTSLYSDDKTMGEVDDSELLNSTTPATKSSSGWFTSWFRSSSTIPAPAPAPTTTTKHMDYINGASQHGHQVHEKEQSSGHGATIYDDTASFADDIDDDDCNTIIEDDDDNNIDSHQDDDENDEIEIPRPPLILKLGSDGTIGILDIRLVGKTIHAFIEDADLTIEVVHQSEMNTSGADIGSSSQQQKKPTATNNTNIPLKTTGDRVLAENIIARYLSIIPNLFLRDVRIRLIIRSTDENNIANDDTVIEVVIGLFSVNDGNKDFLLNFAGEVENESSERPIHHDSNSSFSLPKTAKDGGNDDSTEHDDFNSSWKSQDTHVPTTVSASTNEFLTKRIRTGRGPEGGIVVRMYPFQHDTMDSSFTSNSGTQHVRWAHETWLTSTDYALIRCSGLDVQAQIYLGTRKEIAINNYGYYAEEVQYEDFTVDAMLFGVDYVVPGPQPPLPKITQPQVVPNSFSTDNTYTQTGKTIFVADSNGIQSCRIASPFHKVARGLIPCHCPGTHLPSECCHKCWTKYGGSSSPHTLDESTPLGGFIAHISVRDPLDINLDRYNLSVLGRLISIFTKPKDEVSSAVDELTKDNVSSIGLPIGSHHSVRSNSLPGLVAPSYSSLSVDESGRSTSSRKLFRVSSESKREKRYNEFSSEAAFPTFMKPEKIQMFGIYIANLRFRVHVLRQDRRMEVDRQYCYWDVQAKCVTLDFQILTAKERPFQDLRMDIGHLIVDQLKGVDRKQIVSLGIRPRSIEYDKMTESCSVRESRLHNSPWPTTAAAMMSIVPTQESILYKNKVLHGVQLRYLAVVDPSETLDRSHKGVNVRFGIASVDTEFSIKNDISMTINEAMKEVLDQPKPGAIPKTTAIPMDSLLKYRVVADGGRVDLKPLISAYLPRTISQGEISKSAGFSVESILGDFQVAYGKPSPIKVLDQGLSLKQLALLPDNVRLRILLFLKDLKPLEAALGLPDTPNSFMRCRAVNHGIVQVADKHNNYMSPSPEADTESRRQALMSELLMLGDDELDNLLALHRRNKQNKTDK